MNFHTYTSLILLFIQVFTANAANKCDLLRYDSECSVMNGKLKVTRTILFQINDPSGDGYSDIHIYFSEGDKIDIGMAQIESVTGKVIRKLRKKEIIEKSAISDISLYEDDFVKTFNLQHTQYPYRIRYSYEITYNRFMQIANWYPVLDTEVPTHEATLVVDIPQNYDIKMNQVNVDKPEVVFNGNRIRYKWESSYTSQLFEETLSAPLKQSLPQVKVVPVSFSYGVEGSYESWESFGNWQYRLIKGLDVLTEDDQKRVDQIVQENSSKRATIEALYQYLQDNTRYINVAIDIGGLKPYPAEYVAQTGYGDCKALTNYMKALLKHAGIKSNYALVYAGKTPLEVKHDFPSQQFNHVILMVPLENDSVWLECTSDILPPGYLGTFTQNRKALLIDEHHSSLVETPSLKPEDVHSVFKYHCDLRLLNNARLITHYALKGRDFERFEYFRMEVNERNKDRIMKYLFPLPSFHMTEWKLERENQEIPQIDLHAQLELTNYVKNYGNSIVFDVIPSQIPQFEKPDKRTLPVLIKYPIYHTDSLTYKVPMNFSLEAVPDNQHVSKEFGSYATNYSLQDGKLMIVRHFKLFAGAYALDEYEQFYEFMNSVYDAESKKTIMISK